MKKFVGSLYDYEYIGNVTSEHSSDKKEVVIITELSKLVSYTDISEEENETVGQKGGDHDELNTGFDETIKVLIR